MTKHEFPSTNVLLVDDDPDLLSMTSRNLAKRGHEVETAIDAPIALATLGERNFEVAIVDVSMPGTDGIQLLSRVRSEHPETEVIMLTGEATVQSAVDAMKMGAIDYLTKPVDIDELMVVIDKAREAGQLRRENMRLKATITRSQKPSRVMIGESEGMQTVFRLIERAGPSQEAILIQGESGTGKELVAMALHEASEVADQPLVIVNCAALTESLLESELFGHEKGAFSGATSAKPGLFEMADGGTLFIDEIGEMPMAMQAKLLRVLEDGSMRRVGSVKLRKVSVRLISASNRDMEQEVQKGNFREDLYYRIDVMTLKLPPLRERGDDIRLLVDSMLDDEWKVEPQAMVALQSYPWPGNVRQLVNAIKRAKMLADDEWIRRENLPSAIAASCAGIPTTVAASTTTGSVMTSDLASVEKRHVAEILKQCGGNKMKASKALGISRRTLYRLIDRYGIPVSGLGDI